MPAIFETFARLQETPHYLKLGDLLDGRPYLTLCRNAHVGVWRASERAFTIRRQKFGRTYLFDEYHWDHDAFPTAKPFLLLPDAVPAEDLIGFLARLEEAHPYEAALETMWAASLALAVSAGRRAFRAAVCGAQGTGKTTLVGALAAHLPHLAAIPEQATEIVKEWGEAPKDMAPERKARFQDEILRRTLALEAEHRARGFVSDRCVVDNLAYAMRLANYSELRSRVAEHLATGPYTHVFLLKRAFPIVDDGVRSTDPAYQAEIERRVEALLSELGVSFVAIESASRGGRVELVLAELSRGSGAGP